ncbi:MAG: head-tail adaptor protein [Chloroflexi bacterium]|nr:MAG: head-tail adaptor protein [Chloroflexota bacterium]
MQAGLLRKRITFQQRNITRSSNGEQMITWGDVVTVWADVRSPVVANTIERDEGRANQVQATIMYDIDIRYRTGLDSTMRILYEGQALDIHSIMDPDGRRQKLRLRGLAVADPPPEGL